MSNDNFDLFGDMFEEPTEVKKRFRWVKILEDLDITVYKFCHENGIKAVSVYNWINGLHYPSLDRVFEFQKAFAKTTGQAYSIEYLWEQV